MMILAFLLINYFFFWGGGLFFEKLVENYDHFSPIMFCALILVALTPLPLTCRINQLFAFKWGL